MYRDELAGSHGKPGPRGAGCDAQHGISFICIGCPGLGQRRMVLHGSLLHRVATGLVNFAGAHNGIDFSSTSLQIGEQCARISSRVLRRWAQQVLKFALFRRSPREILLPNRDLYLGNCFIIRMTIDSPDPNHALGFWRDNVADQDIYMRISSICRLPI